MLLIFAHCNPKTSKTTCKTSWLKAMDFVLWTMLSPSSSSGNRSHGLLFLKRERTRWIFSHLGARMEAFFPFPITTANPLNSKSCGLAHGNACMPFVIYILECKGTIYVQYELPKNPQKRPADPPPNANLGKVHRQPQAEAQYRSRSMQQKTIKNI